MLDRRRVNFGSGGSLVLVAGPASRRFQLPSLPRSWTGLSPSCSVGPPLLRPSQSSKGKQPAQLAVTPPGSRPGQLPQLADGRRLGLAGGCRWVGWLPWLVRRSSSTTAGGCIGAESWDGCPGGLEVVKEGG